MEESRLLQRQRGQQPQNEHYKIELEIITLAFHDSTVEPRPPIYPVHGRAALELEDDDKINVENQEDKEDDYEEEEWSSKEDEDVNNGDDDGDKKLTVNEGSPK